MNTQNHLIIHRSSLLLKGIGIATFGLVALCYPGSAIEAMMFPFGFLVAINGAVVMVKNTKYFTSRSYWRKVSFRKGMAECAIGIIAIAAVLMDFSVFAELIALWLIATGSMLAINFYRLRDRLYRWQVMACIGIFSVLSGLFVAFNTVFDIIQLSYEISILALTLGISLLYAYVRLGKIRQYLDYRPRNRYTLKAV